MKNSNLIASALAVLALAGCATEHVYQPSVQVLFTTPETIKMRWHTLRFTEAEAQAMAVAYCKGAQVAVVDAGPLGEYREQTWRCS